MENYSDAFTKSFYQALEKSISGLPQSVREELYRPCAVGCVQNFVLKEMQRQFEECGRSLDSQYEKYGRTEFFFADIIEAGHIYEMGYPRCLCPVVEAKFTSAPTHCECSRQSILFVLQTLLPDKKIQLELMHTVLSGADECRFRAIVE